MLIDPATVEHYLHEHIPITRAMGLKVTAYDGDSVRLWAPLEPNLNHRNTAFGGSLSTLGILAGWSLLHVKMQEAGHRGAAGHPAQQHGIYGPGTWGFYRRARNAGRPLGRGGG